MKFIQRVIASMDFLNESFEKFWRFCLVEPNGEMIENYPVNGSAVQVLEDFRFEIAGAIIHDNGQYFVKPGERIVDLFQRFVVLLNIACGLYKTRDKIGIGQKELGGAFVCLPFFVPVSRLRVLKTERSAHGMKPEMNKFVCEIETLFGGRLVVIHKNAAFLFAFDEYSADGVAFKGANIALRCLPAG